MRPWPEQPVVHEVFTWVWLADLSRRLDRVVTLADVPDDAWDDIARPGIDAVWLMGVWERSPIGEWYARTLPEVEGPHRAALADLADEDVVGSAYCIRRYSVDLRLGGDDGLAAARAALAARGVRLVLDLVPNHVAPDHDWVHEHPEYFIHGSADDLARDPASFTEVGGRVFARGRDPYFPAWKDVLQLDASHGGLRAAMADLAVSLTQRCDGVRCDMAMLVLDDVFTRTWGGRASGGPSPDGGRGFWPTVIGAARAARPDFVFWAEAYWGLEPTLVEQGFDACYDKALADRLTHGAAPAAIRAGFGGSAAEQRHTVRFVENHDEPRAASLLSPAAHRAALVTVFAVPGVALLHEGEAQGRRVRVPVSLGRRPDEPVDHDLDAFVARLLAACAGGLRTGEWAVAPIEGWPDNDSGDRLGAWTWTGEQRHLVVVELSGQRADGRVRVPWSDLAGRTWTAHDLLTGAGYERDGDELADTGLYVALDGHGVHVLRFDPQWPLER